MNTTKNKVNKLVDILISELIDLWRVICITCTIARIFYLCILRIFHPKSFHSFYGK